MNLNSYLGLMGGRYRIRETASGAIHLPVRGGSFDLEVPDPDYVLTLDADSMLLPEYCLRLVAFLERPENADVAIVQTPYSAFRGAPTRLERIAGATTDLQHIVHQGLTHYDATFWVGANAVIRKPALDTVMTEESHNGFTIRHYIKDRTVIEDTESSIDLRMHGWRLENYPERLSYSATPPDFGALCVQRQRWANGGLLVLPRLLPWRGCATARSRRAVDRPRCSCGSATSPRSAGPARACWLLLFYPFDQQLLSRYAVLTAMPYFVAISTDLRRCGYKRLDVLRLYGLNMMLLPVNTVGAARSIGQAIGGQKSAFARTPKVRKPHGHAARVRGVPVRARRLVVRDARERPRRAPLPARRVLGRERRDHPVRDAEPPRHPATAQRRRPRRARLAATARSARAARTERAGRLGDRALPREPVRPARPQAGSPSRMPLRRSTRRAIPTARSCSAACSSTLPAVVPNARRRRSTSGVGERLHRARPPPCPMRIRRGLVGRAPTTSPSGHPNGRRREAAKAATRSPVGRRPRPLGRRRA